MTELTPSWRGWGRALAATAAGAFVVSTLITLLLALDLSAPAPDVGSAAELPDRILAVLQNETLRFPQELVAALLIALSFAALAGLAPVLTRLLAAVDWRGPAMAGAFVLAAGIGIVAALVFIGGQAVASNDTYCDCKYSTEQIIARGGILDLVASVQQWLIYGALVVFAAGLLLSASLARGAGIAPGWAMLSYWLAVVLAVDAIFSAGFPRLANVLGWDVNVDLITGVPSLVALLVLVPWWALWLRRLLAGSTGSA